jgi:hypothetical protein
MSKKYNILWIDDEWDKMPTFKQECEELYNLVLVPFRTRKAGMQALEDNLEKWQAVLLDAKMFDESENEQASLAGLGKAKAHLDRLSVKKAIPYFISTGQPDLLDDDNFKALFGNYYTKAKDDEKLMADILQAILNAESSQIKAIYSNIFASSETLGISEYIDSIILDILLPLHYTEKQSSFKPIHHYNQLRQLVEYLFRACHKVGLIPDQCIPNGIVNLNQCSIYLAGKNAEKAGVRYGEPGERVIPEYIEAIIRSVLDFGNVHSHTVELDAEDTIKIENILRSSQSKYLIFGLTLQLCEAITWFAKYISEHDDKEVNLLYCQGLIKDDDKAKYEGKICVPEQDENGVWHCEECLVILSHWESGRMKLKEISDNTNKRTNGKYPYFAKFDKVE